MNIRKRLLPGAVVVAVLFAATVAHADNLALGSYFCNGQGISATGEGSLSQVPVHSDVFTPAFAAGCPPEAGLVSYLGTGDSAGVHALMQRARPFVSSDVPLTTVEKVQMETVFGRTSLVHQIPLYVDGWAIAYNVPCSGPPINFTSNMLSQIYLEVVEKWNDPLIVAGGGPLSHNNWLASCNEEIRLVKRADEAGATTIFQDYLSKRNPQWLPFRRQVAGQQWPPVNFDCSGRGDDGMALCINSFRGSIGYMRMSIAAQNFLSVGNIENTTGSFVGPSADGCSAAAQAAVAPPNVSPRPLPPTFEGLPTSTPWWPATLGDWSAVSMTDAPDRPLSPKSYPVCALSYVFILQQWYGGYGGSLGINTARPVVDYFIVALQDSTQNQLAGHNLGRLPPNILEAARTGINSVSIYSVTPNL